MRSSFSDRDGTWVVGIPEEELVEQAIISGVAHDRSEAKVTVVGVPDKPGEAAGIFRAIADADVNIDMIVQNVSGVDRPHRRLVHAAARPTARRRWRRWRRCARSIGFESLLYDDHIGKVSLVGAGMRSHPGVSATFFEALAVGRASTSQIISTSEIRISVVCQDTDVPAAVRAVHDAFELGDPDG